MSAGPNGITCGTCIFADMGNMNDIFCRRYPASIVVVKSKEPNGKATEAVKQFYPNVHPVLDWCGEHSVGKENLTEN